MELGAAGSGPPAHVNVVAGEWLEAVHGQLEGPALAGLAGRCLPGGVADAEDLGRSGGMKRDYHGYHGRSPAQAERNDDSGGDDGSGDGSYGRQAARVTPPHRQGSDCPRGLRLGRCGPAGGRLAQPGLVPGRSPKRGNRLDLGLGLSRRLEPGYRVGPGGGLVLGVSPAISLGALVGQGGDHCGDRPVFEAAWRLDMRRKVADDPADVAVFLDDALTVAAPAQMAVELGSLGLGQVAEYEVEGLGMGQLDVPLRRHRRPLAGWPARPATCRRPWPSGI